MLAIISLFIHILEYPDTEMTQSDIALLDIGAGHFGQIHHLTSGRLSFRFPRQVSMLASKAVEQLAKRVTKDMTAATQPPVVNPRKAPGELNDSVVSMNLPNL